MKRARKYAVITLLSLSALLFILGLVTISLFFKGESPDLTKFPTDRNVLFYDKEDQLIEQDDYARSNEISEHIKDAFIALEDKRFYEHNGIDPIRMVGAATKNLKARNFAQGGSTITCQLIKNTHLNSEKTIKRKIKESKIALGTEKIFTKDEILEMYLNVIYFGKGIYGVKNACSSLYGKLPSEVTPLEAASLAAIVANPKKYSPIFDLHANEKRARLVLKLMLEQKKLTESEYHLANDAKIVISYCDFHNNNKNSYLNSALSEYKQLIASGRVKKSEFPIFINTYLDQNLQNTAQSAVSTINIRKSYGAKTPNAELILADNQTGGILAAVTNEKTLGQNKRQPGSLLKPFIYASAIEEGILLPQTPLLDEPVSFNGYRPTNYHNKQYGWIEAKTALSKSLNTTSVSLLNKQGISIVFDRIERCGIPLDKKDKTLALALGGTTYGSTILEIGNGYLTLANYGKTKNSHFIRRITDSNGKILYSDTAHEIRVFSEQSAFLLTEMLTECAQSGTAKQLSYLKTEVAAKTGTVAKGEGNSDAWCAGYTSEHTFVCRYSSAYGDLIPNDITGGNQPTKTARAFLRSLYADHSPAPFHIPSTIRRITVNKGIKDSLHILVPYHRYDFGESEEIYMTDNYQFDFPAPEQLFLSEMTISGTSFGSFLSFKKATGIDYFVYVNGKECFPIQEGYLIEKSRFPLVKLEIVCKNKGKTLYKKAKILRLP